MCIYTIFNSLMNNYVEYFIAYHILILFHELFNVQDHFSIFILFHRNILHIIIDNNCLSDKTWKVSSPVCSFSFTLLLGSFDKQGFLIMLSLIMSHLSIFLFKILFAYPKVMKIIFAIFYFTHIYNSHLAQNCFLWEAEY